MMPNSMSCGYFLRESDRNSPQIFNTFLAIPSDIGHTIICSSNYLSNIDYSIFGTVHKVITIKDETLTFRSTIFLRPRDKTWYFYSFSHSFSCTLWSAGTLWSNRVGPDFAVYSYQIMTSPLDGMINLILKVRKQVFIRAPTLQQNVAPQGRSLMVTFRKVPK